MFEKKSANNIFWFGVEPRSHYNIRYSNLFSRFTTVDAYRISLNRIQFTLYVKFFSKLMNLPFSYLSNKYRFLFCTNLEYIKLFKGGIIVDSDDPSFSLEEIEKLSHHNVRAIVTTTEILKERFIHKGVSKDIITIPQGLNLQNLNPEKTNEIAQQYKETEDIVIGFSAPYLLLTKDISHRKIGDETNSIEFLIQIMEKVWLVEPHAKLWLLGKPSKSIINYAKEKTKVKLLGYIQHANILDYIRNFDIAVYPRLVDFGGRFSIKLIEYMGCGVPIVSANVSESFIVNQAGSGIISNTNTIDDFAESLIELCRNIKLRKLLGDRGKEFATNYDWNIIAKRYQREVFDIYCV